MEGARCERRCEELGWDEIRNMYEGSVKELSHDLENRCRKNNPSESNCKGN